MWACGGLFQKRLAKTLSNRSRSGENPLISTATNLFGRMVSQWRWWHALILLLSIFLLSYVSARWLQNARLERRYAEMRAAGYPVTLEELNEYYALPEGVEDNTALWLEAMRLVETASSDIDVDSLPIVGFVEQIPPVGEPWPEKELVAEYLRDQADALQAIHTAAAAGGGVRYPLQIEYDWWIEVKEVSTLRQCARLISLETQYCANDGNIAGTADSLRTAFAVGKTLERAPDIVAYMVRLTLDGMAVEDARQLLDQVQFSGSDLVSIQTALRKTDYASDLHRGMVGERISSIQLYDVLELWEFDPIPARILSMAAPTAKVKHADLMGEVVDATTLPLPVAFATGKTSIDWEPNYFSISDRLVAQVLPSLHACFRAAARAEARASTLDAAIAAELYRREHGSFPTTFDELVPTYLPAVPIDPFDGKPIRYLLNDDGLVIYSIGWDFVDHGGVLVRKDDQGNPEYVNVDIGVRLDSDGKADSAASDE